MYVHINTYTCIYMLTKLLFLVTFVIIPSMYKSCYIYISIADVFNIQFLLIISKIRKFFGLSLDVFHHDRKMENLVIYFSTER